MLLCSLLNILQDRIENKRQLLKDHINIEGAGLNWISNQ